MVAHTYNPSYSGSGDPEDQNMRSAWAKISKTPSHLGVVVCACHPSYPGGYR
jgi:hypothetical protein